MAKKDLQKRAAELGIEYTPKTTVAQLEELIGAAEAQDAPAAVSPVDDEGRCKACGRPGGSNHVHTRLGR